MAKVEIDRLRAHVLDRVRTDPMERAPYPHLLISNLVPDEFYRQAMTELRREAEWTKASYPGTGIDRSNESYHDHGFVLENANNLACIDAIRQIVHGEEFSSILIERFRREPADRGGIPEHKYVSLDSDDYSIVSDLHRDLPGYEITPHADIDAKILTFLFYLEPDEVNAAWGTHLCVPAVGLSFEQIEREPAIPGNPHWRSWDLFETERVAAALPNTLLVFAPHKRSFHGVKLDMPAGHQRPHRTVLRGFLRAGKDAQNWVQRIGEP